MSTGCHCILPLSANTLLRVSANCAASTSHGAMENGNVSCYGRCLIVYGVGPNLHPSVEVENGFVRNLAFPNTSLASHPRARKYAQKATDRGRHWPSGSTSLTNVMHQGSSRAANARCHSRSPGNVAVKGILLRNLSTPLIPSAFSTLQALRAAHIALHLFNANPRPVPFAPWASIKSSPQLSAWFGNVPHPTVKVSVRWNRPRLNLPNGH